MAQYEGLTTERVMELQKRYGKNIIEPVSGHSFICKLKNIIREPIYILLGVSAAIYFLLGEMFDGSMMLLFVLFVVGIDILQETRTGNALNKLREYSEPKAVVIRDGIKKQIDSKELVPGDVLLVFEGNKIPADGILISSSGLCVDESIMTGEALGVWKEAESKSEDDNNAAIEEQPCFRSDYCYAQTMVLLGCGTILVDKTGCNTQYGRTAMSIVKADEKVSLLQSRMNELAGLCTRISCFILLGVSLATFFNTKGLPIHKRLIESLLAGVVLALSMIPGEFPIIRSVFLSMGALRLARKNALVRKLAAVETLGLVSVLCVDKTGTITNNKMQVTDFWHAQGEGDGLCRALALSCREDTYDPMEEAMMSYCGLRCHKGKLVSDCLKACIISGKEGVLIREYPFTNELKAMGRVWDYNSSRIIAAKGSPETIMQLCNIPSYRITKILEKIDELAGKGCRVIAVAERSLTEDETVPESLLECSMFLKGVIGLADPPRIGIEEKIKAIYGSGMQIIMITGDHQATAAAIAGNIGLKHANRIITGKELTELTDEELKTAVKECNIFARVLPLHKLRIIKALKDNGEVTAMTGDGVNDCAALKAADIGVSMGRYGSEVCREAADLVLLDDNLQTILDSVEDGRRIYMNIGKAVGYVLAIHIPIALISLLAPLIGIPMEEIMLYPLHIVILELIMDPICSVAFERLPSEEGIMSGKPYKADSLLLTGWGFIKSIIQGTVIFAVCFFTYYSLLMSSFSHETARAAGFAILILANIFLVMENCSASESIIRIIYKLRHEKGIWLLDLIMLLELVLMLYSPISAYLGFTALSPAMLTFTSIAAIISVFWYEGIKLILRKRRQRDY